MTCGSGVFKVKTKFRMMHQTNKFTEIKYYSGNFGADFRLVRRKLISQWERHVSLE